MTGKEKCTYLKQLRNEAAKKNHIDYHSEECTFQGECKGTCPKCEAELRELSRKINERNRKKSLIGVGIGVAALGLVGCTNTSDVGDGVGIVGPSVPIESNTEVEALSGDVEVAICTTEEATNSETIPNTDGSSSVEGKLVETPEESSKEASDPGLTGGISYDEAVRNGALTNETTQEETTYDNLEPLSGEADYVEDETSEVENSEVETEESEEESTEIPTYNNLEPLAGVLQYDPKYDSKN